MPAKTLRRQKPTPMRLAAAAAALLASPLALAGTTIELNDRTSLSIGGGLRVSYSSTEESAPGTGRDKDVALENARLYLSARYDKVFGFTLNTEIRRDPSGNEDGIRALDAYVQYEPSPVFNIWAGRLLPPGDRAHLDGPFYLMAWDYPFVTQYPGHTIGRDNGVTVWGKPLDGKLTYVIGAFEGHNRCRGCSNDDRNPLYAARLAYAFLDAEPAPGYYTSSTYYGAKDILSVGVAGMYQADGVGRSSTEKDDYTGYSLDLLFEKNLGPGVLTLEGIAYEYDFDVVDAALYRKNIGGLTAGNGYQAGAAWLFPQVIGYGKFQPHVRYQRFEPDDGAEMRSVEVGLSYLIDGQNAKLMAVYTDTETAGTKRDRFLIGAQFQY